jgi:nucleotide-binding universal stress UspA family protein
LTRKQGNSGVDDGPGKPNSGVRPESRLHNDWASGVDENHSMSFAHRSIVHPTDFSDLSSEAFAHALRIAVAARSTLHVLHVGQDDGSELAFPRARRLLAQWGLLDDDDPPSAISTRLGMSIDNIRLQRQDPTQGIVSFLSHRPSDLVVCATHGRDGVEQWLKGSVAESVLRRSAIPALFIAPGARGFVSQVSGDLAVRRVLVPVDVSPRPGKAVETVQQLIRVLAGANVTLHLLHVGSSVPPVVIEPSKEIFVPELLLRSGNVVNAILEAAVEFDVDFIGVPTAGHHGILDALRGSTTERIIRHAPCPVFAIPVRQ